MPGSGKTTVGTLLGTAPRRRPSATPTTTSSPPRASRCPTSSSTHGEAHFRGLERDAVARALTRARGVLALGGGAVLDAGHPRAADRAPRSWLRGRRRRRCAAGRPRRTAPVLLGNVRAGSPRLWRTAAALRGGRRPVRSTPMASRRARWPTPSCRPRLGSRWLNHAHRGPRRGATTTSSSGATSRRGRRSSSPAVRRVAVVHPAARPASAQPSLDASPRPAAESSLWRCPTASRPRRPTSPPRAGPPSAARASPAPTPSSASAGARPPTSPGSSPPPGCAAYASCRCRPRCSGWSTPRSAARPASTRPRARTSSAPSTRPRAWSATSTSLRHAAARRTSSAGLAEVVKVGFIADPVILDLVEADPRPRSSPDGAVTARARRARRPGQGRGRHRRPAGDARRGLAERCSTTGTRSATPSSRSRATPGDTAHAVSVGMVFAAELARLAGRLATPSRPGTARCCESLGLPHATAATRWPELLDAMRVDKKSRGDRAAVRRARRRRPARRAGGPDPDLLGRGLRRGRQRDVMTTRARAERTQPRPAGLARAGRLRHATYDDLVDRAWPGARRSGSRSRCGRPTTRPAGRLAARGRGRAGRSSSTRRPSRTTPTRCATPARSGRPRSSRCTSPTPPPARSSGTPPSSPAVATGTIAGFGVESYVLALRAVAGLVAP